MSKRALTEKETDYRGLKQAEASLPASWYYDAGQYQKELSAIWQRNWLYLCRSDALKEARAFKTYSIGDQNIFVLRTNEGALAGYYNVCRHRGSVLITEPEGRLKSKVITCPYHQWCYAGDNGHLIRTSSKCEPAGFEKTKYGLFPVSVQEWRGFVFVNLDAGAIWDADTAVARGAGYIKNFPLEDLVVGHRWSRRVACNWKTFWDNFNECLHCPNVHPGLTKLVPLYKKGLLSPRDLPDWRQRTQEENPDEWANLRAGAETWSMDGSAQGHVLKGLTDEEVARGHSYVVALPGTYIACHADHVRIARLLPLGPELMELSMEWLFSKDALNDPDYNLPNVYEFATTVLEEDCQVSELNQRGMRAAPFEGGVLMPEEYYLKSFHDWVRAALRE